MTKYTKQCPDCSGTLEAIKILDATEFGTFSDDAYGHTELQYAAADAKPSFWKHAIPSKGKVNAFICTDCARIFLYGNREQS